MHIKVILLLFTIRSVVTIQDFQFFTENENSEKDGNAESNSFDFNEARQFLRNISSRVQVFSAKGENKFLEMEDKIKNRKAIFEESLEKSIENSESRLEAEKENDIKKGVSKGKDEAEIQKCLDDLNLNLIDEMKGDNETAEDCFNYATDKAVEILNESKEGFNLTIKGYLDAMISLPFTLQSCFDEKNIECIEKGVANTRQNIKEMIDLGKISLQTAREAVLKQKQEMDDCRDEFLENLRQVEDAFSTLIRQCVKSAKFLKHKKEEKKTKYKRN